MNIFGLYWVWHMLATFYIHVLNVKSAMIGSLKICKCIFCLTTFSFVQGDNYI